MKKRKMPQVKTNEKLLLEKFKVEELEKRYEMGWLKPEYSVGIKDAPEPIVTW